MRAHKIEDRIVSPSDSGSTVRPQPALFNPILHLYFFNITKVLDKDGGRCILFCHTDTRFFFATSTTSPVVFFFHYFFILPGSSLLHFPPTHISTFHVQTISLFLSNFVHRWLNLSCFTSISSCLIVHFAFFQWKSLRFHQCLHLQS